MKILLIDHHKTTQKVVKQLLTNDDIFVASEATSAIVMANDVDPDLVILELSLSLHSGMEFLYEFRTYSDWRDVPVIIYSTLRLEGDILNSVVWKQLGITKYLYKPDSSLKKLSEEIDELRRQKTSK